MSKFPALDRLLMLKNYLYNNYRTKADILEHLQSEGYDVSLKTIERDFKALNDFGYEITRTGMQYLLSDNRYYINDLLLQYEKATALSKVFHQNDDIIDYVLGDEGSLKGIDKIPDLLKALSEKRKLSFLYKKNHKKDVSNRICIPVKLTEKNGFWYLIGFDITKNAVRTFGIDRISNLKLTENFHVSDKRDEIIEQLSTYKNMYGLSYPIFNNYEICNITLKVSETLINYWKHKPIHHSQRIGKQDDDGFTHVYLKLIPNLDLIKLIISGLGEIKVVAPEELKTHFIQNYSDLIKKISS